MTRLTMQFPARFADLPEHAFSRLRRLLDATLPGGQQLARSIGRGLAAIRATLGQQTQERVE